MPKYLYIQHKSKLTILQHSSTALRAILALLDLICGFETTGEACARLGFAQILGSIEIASDEALASQLPR